MTYLWGEEAGALRRASYRLEYIHRNRFGRRFMLRTKENNKSQNKLSIKHWSRAKTSVILLRSGINPVSRLRVRNIRKFLDVHQLRWCHVFTYLFIVLVPVECCQRITAGGNAQHLLHGSGRYDLTFDVTGYYRRTRWHWKGRKNQNKISIPQCFVPVWREGRWKGTIVFGSWPLWASARWKTWKVPSVP